MRTIHFLLQLDRLTNDQLRALARSMDLMAKVMGVV